MSILGAAQGFIAEAGRDIDQVCLGFHFGRLAQEELLITLERYQNPDGGFGHGLEVDIQAPESNPFATELALLICIQAQIPASHPLLRRTVAYLEETQHPDGDWRFAPAIYQHELAPWFQGWTWPNLNPGCTTAGLLKELGAGSAQLHGRAEALFQRLATVEDLLSDDFYRLRPYAYYFLPEWDHPQRDLYLSGLTWSLIRQHSLGTVADSEHFFAYIRSSATYPGRTIPAAIVSQHLDRLAAEQAEDGGWPSPYNERWRPWTTLQNLLTLQAFKRM